MERKRENKREPKVVVLGGGTGQSVFLKGLKEYTSNITAVVTVADDGGGSGVLREEMGVLPPGDIRNCIIALSSEESVMKELMQYRFKEGSLQGQSFGNLFLTALSEISGGFDIGISKLSDILAVKGRVLPVTLEDVNLKAFLKNGETVQGESKIPAKVIETKSQIERIELVPKSPKPYKDVIEAIRKAEIIVLGPGSLYTSIIPNLLTADISREIENSKALKVYITNVMTQPGETENHGVYEHLDAILKHSNHKVVDVVVVNDGQIPEDIRKKYKEDNSTPVYLKKGETGRIKKLGIKVLETNIIEIQGDYVRHNSSKLAEVVTSLKWKKSKEI